MRAWAKDVWIAEAPLRFFGMQFGTRMTVVRLAEGGLLVHSPIAIDDALAEEIEGLGPVVAIVSPNKLHHLYLESARRAFPGARVFAPPGLAAKRPALHFDAELGDVPDPLWAATLDQGIVRGSWLVEEVVWYHGASRSLIVGDLCEHFGPHSTAGLRVVTRVARMYGRPCMPPDWRFTFRDRAATRASFERIFAWDFDRVILAHGALLESGARAMLEREFAWAREKR